MKLSISARDLPLSATMLQWNFPEKTDGSSLSPFTHGFTVLSKEAVFAYKCDNNYMPSAECGIRFDDPVLGIDWRVKPDEWILSPKDTVLPSLAEIEPWEEKA